MVPVGNLPADSSSERSVLIGQDEVAEELEVEVGI